MIYVNQNNCFWLFQTTLKILNRRCLVNLMNIKRKPFHILFHVSCSVYYYKDSYRYLKRFLHRKLTTTYQELVFCAEIPLKIISIGRRYKKYHKTLILKMDNIMLYFSQLLTSIQLNSHRLSEPLSRFGKSFSKTFFLYHYK